MNPENKTSQQILEDERTVSVGNKYGYHAFIILSAYVFLSLIFKPFIFDIHPLFYWDYGIVMILAILYMIFKMSDEGVAMEPVVNPLDRKIWPNIFKIWFPVGLALGLFIIFWVVPQEENWASNFPGHAEKLTGVAGIADLFCIVMAATLFILDTLPGKRAKRRAEILADKTDNDE